MGGEFVDTVVDGEEKGDSGEYGKGNERALAAVVIDLGDQVARGYI